VGAITYTVRMVFGLALTLASSVLVVQVVSWEWDLFSLLFPKVPNFYVEIYGLALGFRFRISFRGYV